jgi:hypothetical protein
MTQQGGTSRKTRQDEVFSQGMVAGFIIASVVATAFIIMLAFIKPSNESQLNNAKKVIKTLTLTNRDQASRIRRLERQLKRYQTDNPEPICQ